MSWATWYVCVYLYSKGQLAYHSLTQNIMKQVKLLKTAKEATVQATEL
jgi:hypothetical protein